MPIELCGYDLLDEVKDERDGTVYKAVRKADHQEVFVKVYKHKDNHVYRSASQQTFDIAHEIILSDPPYPANVNYMQTRVFPTGVNGSIYQFFLKPGVRKPGNWAITTVRVAKNRVKQTGRDNLKVLDLGCGSGVVGIMLGLQPGVGEVVLTDIDPKAIESARINAEWLGLTHYRLYQGDLFGAVPPGEKFDMILFTPPFYPSLIQAEDKLADIGGPQGIELAERYASTVRDYLSDEGCSVMYMAEYIPYRKVHDILSEHGLSTEIEQRDILYPYEPKFNFPPANEILWKDELEPHCNFRFTDYEFEGRKFLGFKMLHLISRKAHQGGDSESAQDQARQPVDPAQTAGRQGNS